MTLENANHTPRYISWHKNLFRVLGLLSILFAALWISGVLSDTDELFEAGPESVVPSTTHALLSIDTTLPSPARRLAVEKVRKEVPPSIRVDITPPLTKSALVAKQPLSPEFEVQNHADYGSFPNHKCERWVGQNLYKLWRDNTLNACGLETATLDLREVANQSDLTVFLGGDFAGFHSKENSIVDYASVPIESRIDVYRLSDFEYIPLIKRYTNVALTYYLHGHIDKMACTKDFNNYIASSNFTSTFPKRTPLPSATTQTFREL